MATAGKGLLLDTSIVVRHSREARSVIDRLSEYEELYAGAYRSARPEKNLAQISRFLEAVDVISPDDSTPEVYGRISAQLAKAGTPIPQNDIWIAAVSLQAELPLATGDPHFEKVEGLAALVW